MIMRMEEKMKTMIRRKILAGLLVLLLMCVPAGINAYAATDERGRDDATEPSGEITTETAESTDTLSPGDGQTENVEEDTIEQTTFCETTQDPGQSSAEQTENTGQTEQEPQNNDTEPTASASDAEPQDEPGTTPSASAENTTSGSSADEADPGPGLEFKIDDKHRFADMKAAYAKGYIPTVNDGKVTVIFPLQAVGTVKGNSITVTPDLGSTADSPFVYKNYQQTVKMTKEKPLGSKSEKTFDIYLVCVKLDLSPKRYNGVYPVMISVEATSGSGYKVEQTFTSFVTITDGRSTEPTEPYVPPETKPKTDPVLYVESYSVTPSPAVAGEPFAVTAVIRSRGGEKTIKNLRIQVGTDTQDLTLLDETDLLFVGTLEPDETAEVTIRYRADPGIASGKCHLSLALTGDAGDGAVLSASSALEIPVTQPMRLEGHFPVLPESANAGDSITLHFQAVNMGKSDAYNVRYEMDIPGLIPDSSAYIGTLPQADSGEKSINVFVGSKSMNHTLVDGEDEYGFTEGTITLLYEDELGREYREEKSFHMQIGKLVIEPATSQEHSEEETVGTQWWIAISAGACILAVIALAGFIGSRRKRKAAE